MPPTSLGPAEGGGDDQDGGQPRRTISADASMLGAQG